MTSNAQYGILNKHSYYKDYNMDTTQDSQTKLSATNILANITEKNKFKDITIFNTLNSTNTFLVDKYSQQPQSLKFAIAEQQTQGKGQHGKEWQSPANTGIWLSFTWEIPQKNIPSLASIVVGIAISNVLSRYATNKNIGLKWLNDIYCQNKKLGGILLENYANTNNMWHIVIGIGINIYPAKYAIKQQTISLTELCSQQLDRNEIIAAIIETCYSMLTDMNTNKTDSIPNLWHKNDILKNKIITIKSAGTIYTGINMGISKLGQLKLMVQNEILSFNQATILHDKIV